MDNSDWALLVIMGSVMAAATIGHLAGMVLA